MRIAVWLTLAALACNGGETDAPGDTEATIDTEPACAELTTGEDWAFHGECPQMTTPCEITFDACGIRITYASGMTMGMPTKGTIEGDTITFRGGDYAGCVGAVVSADEVTGSCGDGCTFDLTR